MASHLHDGLFTLPPQSVRWNQAAAALNAVLTPFVQPHDVPQRAAGG